MVQREELKIDAGCSGRIFDAQKMYDSVEKMIRGVGMKESARALEYACEAHAGSKRKGGQTYIVHPLGMAMYLLSLESKFITDTTIAIALLHDVPEEENIPVEEMPFSDSVKCGVDCLTVTGLPGETKYETERRCAWKMLECFDAVVCRSVDMYNNLRTMPGIFAPDRIQKYVVEADLLRLPVLKQAAIKWPGARDLLYVLQENVKTLIDAYATIYGVKLTDPSFVNAEGARDYAYLLR